MAASPAADPLRGRLHRSEEGGDVDVLEGVAIEEGARRFKVDDAVPLDPPVEEPPVEAVDDHGARVHEHPAGGVRDGELQEPAGGVLGGEDEAVVPLARRVPGQGHVPREAEAAGGPIPPPDLAADEREGAEPLLGDGQVAAVEGDPRCFGVEVRVPGEEIGAPERVVHRAAQGDAPAGGEGGELAADPLDAAAADRHRAAGEREDRGAVRLHRGGAADDPPPVGTALRVPLETEVRLAEVQFLHLEPQPKEGAPAGPHAEPLRPEEERPARLLPHVDPLEDEAAERAEGGGAERDLRGEVLFQDLPDPGLERRGAEEEEVGERREGGDEEGEERRNRPGCSHGDSIPRRFPKDKARRACGEGTDGVS